ncbi:flagellar protein FliT [Clostridium ljungdahlii]|uniref:Flagellar protein FliT n=1 Tax=Clostridium ljungdahlii TaxID=1538 RepID=A0A170NBB5_9CLOT|nr:flagellar protein FliT [Clostridium ljungdahlii]OAA83174.1 hypothetical protein WY13_03502 [Clostridium ljungdahlii]
MKLDLERDMENLRDVTCELIDKLQKNDYDALENLMDERQKLLDNLEKLHCTKERYRDAIDQFQVITFQQKLSKIMAEKKHKLREKIDDISRRKSLTKGYNKHIGASIFSKKI